MKKNMKKSYKIALLSIVCGIGLIILIFAINMSRNIMQAGADLQHTYANEETIIDNTQIIINKNNKYTFENTIQIEINVDPFLDDREYYIKYGVKGTNLFTKNISESNFLLEYQFTNEGTFEFIVEVYRDKSLIKQVSNDISYIIKYEKQFLDELSNNGTIVHYLNGTWEKYEKTADLLIDCGIKNVRTTFSWRDIEKENDEYDFTYYDKWIEKLTQNGVNIIACFNRIDKYSGDDAIINNNNEKEEFLKFAKVVIERYPQIKYYEFINEPNLNLYITDEGVRWYVEILKELSKYEEINIITGGTNTPNEDSQTGTKSSTFFNQIFRFGAYNYIDNFAYHPYDSYDRAQQNERFYMKLEEHKNIFRDNGGFVNHYVTEYGVHITNQVVQANKLIQQAVILDLYDVKFSIQYNLWNTGTNLDNVQNNYGLITNDYLPKKSYYAMKNFYKNTNGAEYIGTVNLADGLESHVYDKDGKAKIITWTNTVGNNLEIDYKDFTAKDLYGNEIENTNGKLTITTSPVYLDDIGKEYFYQAISNTANEKYNQFEEQFREELQQIPNVAQNIKSMKEVMQQVATINELSEDVSKQLMQKHFQLGNIIIKNYRNENLKIEKIKLSSMLDALNDIGNSFEDLVTITATTRNINITETKDLIDETRNIIDTNSDLEIVYPIKILEFSKDYYEKAKYINELEEENDIKTGLIVSNNIHSLFLVDWAKEFTNIYIDEYLKNDLLQYTYSKTEITNENVTVTLNIGNDVKITNNNGSNKYTFKENGSFTFEYERRERTFKQTVEVKNIDKQAPTFVGVDEGQVYGNAVTPIIIDENLKDIKLVLDGRIIENYKNTELKDEGIYRIEATDKAGNKTIVNFEIIEKITDDYIEEENIIKNIQTGTKIEEFIKNINVQEEYNITRSGKQLEQTDIIATGDILVISEEREYTLIVSGDLDKDGEVGIKDLIKLRQHIIEEATLDEFSELAGDIDLNNKLDARDIVKIRKIILNK